ncbi:restriction endonuclease subunit S [Plantactinospora sp. CA-294935]|uniref:restriction endonuclease subunit S n=1 Tax=Plantactinospora sp. CA-294935 TaxID=3240012 RepID=UPI003D90E587
MSGLPHGWMWVSLDEVAEIRGGIQKQAKRRPVANTYPFLRVANVLRGQLNLADVHEIELFDGEIDRYRLRKGDLLVVEGNGSPDQIGRAAVWDGSIENCVHQNHLIRVRPSGAILPAYLQFAWNSPMVYRHLRRIAGSTSGLYTLSTSKLSSVRLPLPPLAEQRRIVAALETLLVRVDAATKTVEAVGTRCEALAQRYIDESIAGAPSEEVESGSIASVADSRQLGSYVRLRLPDSYALPKRWRVATLEQLVRSDKKPAYGVLVPGEHVEDGTPFVRIGDLARGGVRVDSLKKIDPVIASKYPRTLLSGGEVLLSLVGTIGRSAVVPSTLAGANVARALGVFPLDEYIVNPRWVVNVLSTSLIRKILDGAANEVARKTLNLEDARRCPIILPPREVQDRIVDSLEAGLDGMWRLRDATRGIVLRSATLRATIFARAFSGRLVPQDPNDEPASELLARIRAERAAVPPKQRAGRGRRTQKDKPAPPTRVIGRDYQQGELPL